MEIPSCPRANTDGWSEEDVKKYDAVYGYLVDAMRNANEEEILMLHEEHRYILAEIVIKMHREDLLIAPLAHEYMALKERIRDCLSQREITSVENVHEWEKWCGIIETCESKMKEIRELETIAEKIREVYPLW